MSQPCSIIVAWCRRRTGNAAHTVIRTRTVVATVPASQGEPVADPGRVSPAEPEGEPEYRRLQGAQRRQALQQVVVGQLGDGEDMDQIEEQLDAGDFRRLAWRAPIAWRCTAMRW